MKKFIFLLLIVPVIALGQQTNAGEETLKKTAETFITNFYKNWENKNWDEILNSAYAEGKIISLAQTGGLTDAFKSTTEYYKTNVTDCKITVNSLSTEVLGPATTLVTARYVKTENINGEIRSWDYLDIYLLEMEKDVWKIKTYYPQYFPAVIFSDKVDKQWQKGKGEPAWRYIGASNQIQGIFSYFMEDYKDTGTSPAELGKMIGARFARYWDNSRGFEGLASGFLWVLQTVSPSIEVLERNETSVKFKYISFQTDEKNWGITQQEMLEYFQNAFGEIATSMGGICSIVEDGKYYVMTIKRK